MALAYMAKTLGKTAHIVMPENSPSIKKKSVKSYDGNVIISGNTVAEREKACEQASQKYKAAIVSPYNDYNIIEGQATVAK